MLTSIIYKNYHGFLRIMGVFIMLMKDAIREFFYELTIQNYTERTIRGYKGNIRRFNEFIEKEFKITELEETMKPHIKKYILFLQQKGLSSVYINGILKNLRSLFKYADDFKIMCRDYKTDQKAFIATKKWLKNRLGLEVSPAKSKVINLRKNYSKFLGIKIKTIKKNNGKHVVKSHICEKANLRIINKINANIKELIEKQNIGTTMKYNSMILGMHNYYKCATHVNHDFSKIAFLVSKKLYHKTKNIRGSTGIKGKAYMKYYGNYNLRTTYITGIALFPINGVKTKPPICFRQEICNYTEVGRALIHKNLSAIDIKVLNYLMKNPIKGKAVEFNDNRISLYVGQNGKCSVTNSYLELGNMEIHHKLPVTNGGTDEYKNLTYVSYDVHKLIHATKISIINKYLVNIKKKIDKNGMKKLNNLRKMVGNCEIVENVS